MGQENEALQTDDDLDRDDVELESGNDEGKDVESSSADDTGADQSKKTDEEPNLMQNENVQKAINRQHKKFRDEEQKRIKAEEENRKLREDLAKAQSSQNEVVIPPMPDPFDKDYDQKVKERDDAIRLQAQREADTQAKKDELAAHESQQQTDKTVHFKGLVDNYNSRITALNLDASEIRQATDTVAEYKVDPQVAELILGHEDGPLISKYLATNLVELDDLRSMSVAQGAVHLMNVIAPAAAKLKPDVTKAPDPDKDDISGRGASDRLPDILKGATFE